MTARSTMGARASTALSSAEAAHRLQVVGHNVAPARARRSTVLRVADQLRDPMIMLLQLAAALGAVLRDWPSTVWLRGTRSAATGGQAWGGTCVPAAPVKCSTKASAPG